MLHLNRGGPWIDIDGVRDEVSLTVPTDRDDVEKLEESANDLLPQMGVPLQHRCGVEAKLPSPTT